MNRDLYWLWCLFLWICLNSLQLSTGFPASNANVDKAILSQTTICKEPVGLTFDLNTTMVKFTLSATEGNATNARLFGPQSWNATTLNDNTYIQVTLVDPITVTGLYVQGDKEAKLWVTALKLTFSMDCVTYYPVFDNGSVQEFSGNMDANSVAFIEFNNVFTAKCLRIIPTERHGNMSSLRLELVGCVASACSNTLQTDWIVNPVQDMLELRFPSEKIITKISILPEFLRDSGYAISFSRSCAHYTDVKDKGVTQIFISKNNDPVTIDMSTKPLRVLCLRITAVDADIRDVTDVQVQVTGCGISEKEVPLESCGRSHYKNVKREKRVVGGIHAFPGDWPWLVSMHFLTYNQYTNRSTFQHVCGATLIHPQWLLSAAHCFDEDVSPGRSNRANWRAHIGEHDQIGREGTEQVINITKIIKHRKFRISMDDPLLKDIALIKLDQSVVLSEYVNVICLDADNAFPPGTPCVVAGWGQNRLVGAGVKLPLHAEIPIIHSQDCDKRYKALPLGHAVRNAVSIADSVLCATTENGGRDACWGDSGGPLVCRRGDHWTQVGIVSIGYECGDSNFPGIYTKIASYMEWISQNIQENSRNGIHHTWLRRMETTRTL